MKEMTKVELSEFDILTDKEKTTYEDAVACGACHDDAMDAVSISRPKQIKIGDRFANQRFRYTDSREIYEITQIVEHTKKISDHTGFTHFAEIKRPNGKKLYCANLLIVNGRIVQSKVIL